MKDSNLNNNNTKKENEQQRYRDFFNSFNDISETDEVLNQIANFNFNEEKNINNPNIKSKLDVKEVDQNILKELNFQNLNNNQEQNVIINDNINKDEKPLSIILLKEKVNRIYFIMILLNVI